MGLFHFPGLVESISESVKQLDTNENSSEKSEELDPIDIDLIRNSLEQISNKNSSNSKSVNLEEEEDEDSFDAKKDNTRVYNVIVSDFETGLTYNLDEVKVEFDKIPSSSTCEIISSQLRFKSESKMKGMKIRLKPQICCFSKIWRSAISHLLPFILRKSC